LGPALTEKLTATAMVSIKIRNAFIFIPNHD